MLTAERFARVAHEAAALDIKYSEMDCQEFVEYCLARIGIRANWKGSNAMWRDMDWTGTPEECEAKFGSVPAGALVFILEDDGGEVRRGYTDGLGNASHVGVCTGRGLGAVHSSSSRGGVFESKFEGKTIRNGGWNRVGLCKLLDYGLDPDGMNAADPAGSTDLQRICHACGQEIRQAYERMLKRGMTGNDVRAVQQALIRLGYGLGESGADGDYGKRTAAAVRQYQKAHGLESDGVVGPKTWEKLMG